MYQKHPPPNSAAEFGRFCRIGLPNCWVSKSRRFVLPNHQVPGTLPPRFADMLGFLGSGSPELEASLTLGHLIIPLLCTLVVQIGTMKCFYCPQKDVSLVPWDSLSSADQAFLRDKYPDAGEGAVCEFYVRSARPQTETVGPSYPPDTSKNLLWTLGRFHHFSG